MASVSEYGFGFVMLEHHPMNRRARLFRAIAFFVLRKRGPILLLTAIATMAIAPLPRPDLSIPDSVLVAPKIEWKRSDLPLVISRRIHVRADQVPPFPHEEEAMRDARAWPKRKVLFGRTYELCVTELGGDTFREVSSLDQVRSGCGWSLYYSKDASNREARWRSRMGPAYYWDSDGRLTERAWHNLDGIRDVTHDYQYLPTGQLVRYSYRSDSRQPKSDPQGPFEWFNEDFAREGALVLCGYSKTDGQGANVGSFYYLGDSLSYRDFSRRQADFLVRAFSAARTR